MSDIDTASNYYRVHLFNGVSLAFIDCSPDISRAQRPGQTIVLIHGFPQTSYQYRKVIPTLVDAGYRVIAPDYRGAGESSKPTNGFTKAIMAADIVALLDHLDINAQVHVVGHDIGGIIAYMLASRWPERVASACFCECLLPGTATYSTQLIENPVKYFHFQFHCVANLPEVLIQGREKTYIDFFINQFCYRIGAFSPQHLQRYTTSYSQPGSLRCALNLYRTLEQDSEDIVEWIAQNGRCNVRCMVMSGEFSNHGERLADMARELVDDASLTSAIIGGSGHFVAEENPTEFCKTILTFIRWQASPPLSARSI